MENFHGDDIYPHNINITSIAVPIRAYLNIKSPNYVNTSQRGTSSHTSTWKALIHSATMQGQPSTLDQASRKLTGEETLTPTTHQVNACSWKLTGVNTASLKLIGELMIQVTFFTLCTLILMQSQKISTPKSCGEDYHKGHLPPLS